MSFRMSETPISRENSDSIAKRMEQEAGHFYNPDMPHEGRQVDLGLMMYNVTKKQAKRRVVRECFCFYLPYLFLILTWVLFSHNIFEGYHMNSALKNAVLRRNDYTLETEKTFTDIHTIDEYWTWMDNVFIPTMFREVGQDGGPLDPKLSRYIAGSNRCFGSIRFRQVRVTNSSCVSMYPKYGMNSPNASIHQDLGCYTEYDMQNTMSHERQSFGPGGIYKYKSCEGNGGGVYTYTKLNTYDCDGYSVFLPFDSTQFDAVAFITKLKKDHWIDKKTRASFVEFFSYNPNINYFVQAKLVVDFTNGGGISTSWAFRVFKLEVLRTAGDYILFTFNLILPLFVIYKSWLLLTTLTNAYRLEQSWRVVFKFFLFWNILDALNILLFCISFILRLLYHTNPDRSKFQITNPEYPHLDFIASIWSLDNYFNSASLILSFFIFYKYFEVLEKFNILIKTIEAAKWTLISVGIFLAIIVFGFTMAGYMMFGMKLEEFRDVGTTISTLLRLLLNDFDYNSIRVENRSFSGPYYTFYVAIAFFLILNMFLAVITYFFGQVVDEQQEIEGEGEYIYGVLNSIRKFFVRSTVDIYETIKRKFEKKPAQYKRAVMDHSAKFDHGDEKLIWKLADHAKKKGSDLTKEDLYIVLGVDANIEVVEGIMKRFDADGDGTISIDEIRMKKAQENIDHEEESEQREVIARKEKIRAATKKSISSDTYLDEHETKALVKKKLKTIEEDMSEIMDLIVELEKQSDTKQ